MPLELNGEDLNDQLSTRSVEMADATTFIQSDKPLNCIQAFQSLDTHTIAETLKVVVLTDSL